MKISIENISPIHQTKWTIWWRILYLNLDQVTNIFLDFVTLARVHLRCVNELLCSVRANHVRLIDETVQYARPSKYCSHDGTVGQTRRRVYRPELDFFQNPSLSFGSGTFWSTKRMQPLVFCIHQTSPLNLHVWLSQWKACSAKIGKTIYN